MSNDRSEHLKRIIKKTYKRYIGERSDGEATLMDVLKLFNISIDESRIEDYSIESIDYSIPSIEVIDKKINAKYTSEYTNKGYLLLNLTGEMTFTDGDYELIFERKMSNYLDGELEFVVRYVKNVYGKDRRGKQILLSKIFKIKIIFKLLNKHIPIVHNI